MKKLLKHKKLIVTLAIILGFAGTVAFAADTNPVTSAIWRRQGNDMYTVPAGQTIHVGSCVGCGGGGGTPALTQFHIAVGDASNLMTSYSTFVYSPTGRFNVDFAGTHPSLDIDLSAHSYQLGDYASQDNKSYLDIDDFNRIIGFYGKFASLGSTGSGLKLDFGNDNYSLGDTSGAANGSQVFVNDATQKVGVNTVNPNAALDVHTLEQATIGNAMPDGGNTGNNDITVGGSMGGNATQVLYTLTTSAGDPTIPNEFHWSGNDGQAGDFVCDGSAQPIGAYGVTVMFSGCAGHNTGDFWTIQVTQPASFSVTSTQGTVPLIVDNDGTQFWQNASSGNDMLWFDPTGGSIGTWEVGDVDLGVNHGLMGWKQTDVSDPTQWKAFVSGSVNTGHSTVDEDFFHINQDGTFEAGDTNNQFPAVGTGTKLVVRPAVGNITDSVANLFNVTDGGGSLLAKFDIPNQTIALGDIDDNSSGETLTFDHSDGSITNKTDGIFGVRGLATNHKLFEIDGTSEITTANSIFQVFDANNHIVFQSNGGAGNDGKTTAGDVGNNIDDWKEVTDPYVSTPNGSQGATTFTGFHGDVGKFYTDGIQFSKQLSQTYISQTFTPVNGHVDLGANTTRLTSATTLTLFGVNDATGSQYYTGAQVTVILDGGQLVKNNQTTATGYAPILLTKGVDYQSKPGDVMMFAYDGTNWRQTSLNGVLVNTAVCGTPGNLAGQTAAVASITTCTPTVDSTIDLSAWINITAVSVNTITTQVTYTDETSTSRTVSFFNMGTTTAALGVTGASQFPVATIHVKGGTTATAKTIVTGVGSETYNVGATFTLAQ